MKTINNNATFFVLIMLILASCSSSTEKSADNRADRGAQVDQEKNITDVTVGKPGVTHISENYDMLSTFAGLYRRGNLDSLLHEDEHYTIFAPSDDAYRNFRNQSNKADSAYNQNLTQNLEHLIVKKTYTATDLLQEKSLETLDGKKLTVGNTNGKITIDNANIIYPDLQASNATIQVIDKVIITDNN